MDALGKRQWVPGRRPAWPRWVVTVLLAALAGGGLVVGASGTRLADAREAREVAATTTTTTTTASAGASSASVLACFQVAQPVRMPDGPATERSAAPRGGCTATLMEHVFGNSYGAPFVGGYEPGTAAGACADTFRRVVLNLTVVSAGRQFDRLALLFLNGTEIWRTSTAEPVAAPGIRWVVLKDATAYLALWRQPQTLVFDLGNLVNDRYTASFNATLTATFFDDDDNVDTPTAPPSDFVLPLSAGLASPFVLPRDSGNTTVAAFPRNAARAVVAVTATGQADEEFWWSNVLQSDVLAFRSTVGSALPGFSPFREVQLRIDGQLAGVQWPFPVIFTGGVVPGLHRPIVGADVFDLREHEMDITPWLPLLCDGQAHTFQLQVAGLTGDVLDGGGCDGASGSANGSSGTATLSTAAIGSSWYVSGKVFVWLAEDATDGAADAATTGTAPVVQGAEPTIQIQHCVAQNATGANETLQYTVTVARTLRVEGTVGGGRRRRRVAWTQTLAYANEGTVGAFGYDQVNRFSVRGHDTAAEETEAEAEPYFAADYAYPLFCNTTTRVSAAGNLTLWAELDQGLERQVSGAGVFATGLEAFAAPGSASFTGAVLSTRVRGTAAFFQAGDGSSSSGFGTTSQAFRFGGLSRAGMLGATPDVLLYARNVTAVNQTVPVDEETIAGVQSTAAADSAAVSAAAPAVLLDYAQAPLDGGPGPRAFLGRGGADPAGMLVQAGQASRTVQPTTTP